MTVRFQAFHSIKAIGNREVLFNWSRTNPLGALDQVWRPTTRDELQQLLREYPERKLRLVTGRRAPHLIKGAEGVGSGPVEQHLPIANRLDAVKCQEPDRHTAPHLTSK
jgi:hypothetical protein